MAQQKFDKAFENLKKEVGQKTLIDFGKYLEDVYENLDISSEIEKFKNISIENSESKKKKIGKTTNYHRFLRKKIEELKDSGDSKQENMREAQKAWKQLSDKDKKMFDSDSIKENDSENDDDENNDDNDNDDNDENDEE